MLSLAEEIFLLSLLEKKDSIRFSSSISLPFSLAGADLIDLVLSNYAKLEDGRLLLCADPGQIPDERIKFAFEKIQQSEKPKKFGSLDSDIGYKRGTIVERNHPFAR